MKFVHTAGWVSEMETVAFTAEQNYSINLATGFFYGNNSNFLCCQVKLVLETSLLDLQDIAHKLY